MKHIVTFAGGLERKNDTLLKLWILHRYVLGYNYLRSIKIMVRFLDLLVRGATIETTRRL